MQYTEIGGPLDFTGMYEGSEMGKSKELNRNYQ